MARVLIQLDPEYVPWDVPEERPKMQRRRRRRRGGGGSGATVPPALFIAVPLLLLVACVVGAVLVGPRRHAETRAETPATAGSPPVVAEAEGVEHGNLPPSAVEYQPVMTDASSCDGAPVLGKTGELLLYGLDEQPRMCSRFAVWSDQGLIAAGTTVVSGCMTLDDEVYQTYGGIVDMRDQDEDTFVVDCYE